MAPNYRRAFLLEHCFRARAHARARARAGDGSNGNGGAGAWSRLRAGAVLHDLSDPGLIYALLPQ